MSSTYRKNRKLFSSSQSVRSLKKSGDERLAEMGIPKAMVRCYLDDVAGLTLRTSLTYTRSFGCLPELFDDVNLIIAKQRGVVNGQGLPRGYVTASLLSGAIIGFMGVCIGFVRNARIAGRFVIVREHHRWSADSFTIPGVGPNLYPPAGVYGTCRR